MSANLRELKTKKHHEKERMLEAIDRLTEAVESDEIHTLIIISDSEEALDTEVIGSVSSLEALGMFELAKINYQSIIFEEYPQD